MGGQQYKIWTKSADPNAFFPTDQWTHVAVTYDSDTKEAKVYRNGIPQETTVKYGVTGTATGVIGPFEGQKSIGYNGPVHILTLPWMNTAFTTGYWEHRILSASIRSQRDALWMLRKYRSWKKQI